MTGRVSVAIMLLALAFTDAGAGEQSSCCEDFLSVDGHWMIADRPAGGVNLEESGFYPIVALYVLDGQLYVETWGAEPKPVPVISTDRGIEFSPRYLDSDSSQGVYSVAASQVEPYTHREVKHIVTMEGSCQSPNGVLVEIIRPEMPVERYTLVKQ